MTKEQEALKLSLEALENKFLFIAGGGEAIDLRAKAITAIREAMAQPKEKVDWEKLYWLEVKKKDALAAKYERDIKPLTKIVPMAQPEHGTSEVVRDDGNICYQYTTPPQRIWVGLTEEEVARLANHELWVKTFIRKIEEKLRSKNT